MSSTESCLETAEIGRRESLDNGWITKNHNIYISNTSLFPILQNHSFATPIMLMYYKKKLSSLFLILSSVTEEL